MGSIGKNLILSLSLVLGLTVGSPTSAQTSKLEVTQDNVNVIKENMLKMNIDEEDYPELSEKIKAGQMLDSQNPEELAKIPKDALTPSLTDPVKRYTFPDGSVIESGIEIISKTELDKEGNVLREFKNKEHGKNTVAAEEEIIKSKCGSGYCNYTLKVYHKTLIVEASFLATVSIIDDGPDRISDVGDHYIWCLYGYSSGESLTINREVELEKIAPAAATLTFTHVAPAGSVISRLRLNVENDRYLFIG